MSRPANKFIRQAFFLVSTLLASLSASASALIDHVTVNTHDQQEEVRIYFNQPVFYLYHTPDKVIKSTLIGLRTNLSGRPDNRTYHSTITTGPSRYIADMEIFSEAGFNTHLYIQFRESVNVTVRPGPELRSIIIKLVPAL